MPARVAVLVETGTTRTFASALDWPGWSRSARTEDDALAALESYRARYAAVLTARTLDAPSGRLAVTERARGDATTDFGAPSAICDADHRVLRGATRTFQHDVLVAAWAAFDDLAARKPTLQTGPRGGGRDAAKMVAHVGGAEVAYARGLGLRVSGDGSDRKLALALRERLLGLVDGSEHADREAKWPLRYGVRRIAWHALDHLFEMQDRATEK